ncbi:MAG: CHASE2 domain-containing protein [Spirulina sp.]
MKNTKQASIINGYRLIGVASDDPSQVLQGQPDSRLYFVEDTRISRWLRRWPTLGPKRILKTINPDSPNRDLLKKSLEIEIQCLKELNHPGIVRYLDDFTLSDIPHLVVEKIPGKTLDQWVDENGIDSEARILDWLTQLADILGHIHSRSILHGDIKPKNIMINQKGELKLIDFGSAQRIDPAYLLKISTSDIFDDDGVDDISITPEYSSAEQFDGKLLPHSDFCMLGKTLKSFLDKPSTKTIRLNPRLRDLLDKMQSEKAEGRPASAEVIQQALDDIANQYYRKPRLYGWGEYVKRSLPISVGVTSVVIGLRFLGVLQPLELQFFDHTLWMRSNLARITSQHGSIRSRINWYSPDSRISIIEINNDDVIFLSKRYEDLKEGDSLSDESLRDLLDLILKANPAVIGIDITHRNILDIRDKNNIIGICYKDNSQNDGYQGYSSSGIYTDNLGFAEAIADNENRSIRRHLVFWPERNDECLTQWSFAYKVLSKYIHFHEPRLQDNHEELVAGSIQSFKLKPHHFLYQNFRQEQLQADFTNETVQVMINYRPYEDAATVYSLQSILEEDPAQLMEIFSNKIVLIGSKARNDDIARTPYGTKSGVIIHAHKISQLLDLTLGKNRTIRYLEPKQDMALVSSWGVIYGLLLCIRSTPKNGFIISCSGLIALYIIVLAAVILDWCFTFLPLVIISLGISSFSMLWSKKVLSRWRLTHV